MCWVRTWKSDTWAAGIREPALPGRGSSHVQSQPWHLARQPHFLVCPCGCECVCVHTCTVRCAHTCMHAPELWGLTSPSVPLTSHLCRLHPAPRLGKESWLLEQGGQASSPGALGGEGAGSLGILPWIASHSSHLSCTELGKVSSLRSATAALPVKGLQKETLTLD